MKAIRRIGQFVTVFRQAKRNRSDLLRWLGRRPQLLAATATYETALLFSNRMDPRLVALAELKAAGMVSCEFCLDIGSALAKASGLTDAQLRDLPRYRDCDTYDQRQRLVLEFADAMTSTPAIVPEELRDRLLAEFSRTQLAELAAVVAWENNRGRLNQALGVRPAGFSDGAACAVPELKVLPGNAS